MGIIGYMWRVIGGIKRVFRWGLWVIMRMRLVGLYWGDSVERGFGGLEGDYGWVLVKG